MLLADKSIENCGVCSNYVASGFLLPKVYPLERASEAGCRAQTGRADWVQLSKCVLGASCPMDSRTAAATLCSLMFRPLEAAFQYGHGGVVAASVLGHDDPGGDVDSGA